MPINNDRNSLQFTAHIFTVVSVDVERNKEEPRRATDGKGASSSWHFEPVEPGWCCLPNGTVAYSDPIATNLTGPRVRMESKDDVDQNSSRRVDTDRECA